MKKVLFCALIALAFCCKVYSDCGEGEVCDWGVCYGSPRELFEPCSREYPCGENLSCELGRCYNIPRNIYEPCESELCKFGLECDGDLKFCVSA
ncbi:unnamed protein product [Blepharisma stoltei]|uniref:Uncharacterized protein n=1 Tax=Blepharisma stoltei TaxID=1481888 RepID=A0AAU9IWY4_9CILI|nr:unnamed protein product [Blepharisma stoltei]